MFDDSNIIVGLEIGTSKICVVVGEFAPDGALNIIGLGQARSRGVRKGEIINPQQVEEDLRAAVFEAEQMADVEIRSVYLGVSGGHVRGFNNRGMHTIVSAEREITEDDVQDVIKNAKAINLPAENTVIHAVRQHFFVEGQAGVTNPVGMLGTQLEVDMHVIHGNAIRLQNAIRLVRGTQLEVDEIVFNGIASSLAMLSPDQKELGTLVFDIGGGTTEYVVYSDGAIRHTGVLAVGGDHVSNDLAYGLKVPLSRAEKLKLEHGSAVVGADAKGPDHHHQQRIGPRVEIHQCRAPATHHVPAPGGNFPVDRGGTRAGRPDQLSARGRRAFGRRFPGAKPCAPGGKCVSDECHPRPRHRRERHHHRAGPAGIRHGHRPGQVWLAEKPQEGSGSLDQEHL